MSYKIITYNIKNTEIHNNILLTKTFILQKETTSLIFGIVSNKLGEKISACAIILQEIDKNTNETIDKNIIFTNDEGYFGFSVTLEENKNYRIVVYTPNNLT